MATWFLAPSLVALRTEVNLRWPNRDKESDGTIGDAAHSSRESDHNPDPNGMVHAIDIDEDLDGNQADSHDLLPIVEWFRMKQDPRIKYVIYEGRIFAGRIGPSPWVWRTYSGPNLHDHHMHVSVTYDVVGERDQSPWLPPLEPLAPRLEDLMPFPVYDVPTDPLRNAFLAVGVGASPTLTPEEYQHGVDEGILKPVEHTTVRKYDVLAALGVKLGAAPATVLTEAEVQAAVRKAIQVETAEVLAVKSTPQDAT